MAVAVAVALAVAVIRSPLRWFEGLNRGVCMRQARNRSQKVRSFRSFANSCVSQIPGFFGEFLGAQLTLPSSTPGVGLWYRQIRRSDQKCYLLRDMQVSLH